QPQLMFEEPIILATAGYENVIKLWQAYSAQLIRQLEHAGSQVNALSISPDRRTLAAAGYEHIRLYDIGDTLVTSPSLSFDMQKNITAVGFDGHGKWMYSGGEDCVCRVWDLRHARGGQGGNPCSRLFQVNGPITSVCLHPNQIELFVGDATGAVHIWDLRSNQSCSLVPDLDARIQSVAVNQAGTHLAALANTGSCFMWSLASAVTNVSGSQAVPKARIAAHSGYGLRCAFSPDSTLLATCGSDRLCNVWKTSDYQKQVELSGADKWVWDCAFSADSEFVVTVSSDGCARLYSIDDGAKPRREYRGSTKSAGHGSTSAKPMTCLAFVDDSYADD
uniref:Target of rapamycin complex subunit lst8 n=1 Tax=Macrostomum lignano TaxID=282301 RepID=A0A1I8GH71_9PLAT